MPSSNRHISLGRYALASGQLVRSFIGIEIESPDLIAKLETLQKEILSSGADLKAVERENLHVTMRFLGDISQSTVEQVIDELKELDFTPFTASLEGVGVFPKITFPRVVWVGVKEGAQMIIDIHRQLEEGLTRLGFRPEREAFTPHVTLFRVRSGRGKASLIEALNQHSEIWFGEFEVRAIQLKQSVLTPRGPIYSTLGEARR